uniref:TACC_C domain-containing protein n=1 Tax=Haemonchus contortus TaxID=6289 RepID=A0A7I4XXR8_HAECO|nr:major antigen [Haemonchus contortus]
MMEVDQESQQDLHDDTAKQSADIQAPPMKQGYSTPQQSKPATDMTDLTKTFTRRPALPKDISPVPDNSVKSDGVSPSPRTNVRSTRQKTMTMDSCGTHELRKLFAETRQSGSSLEELEAKVVDLFRTKEAEMNGRLAKVMEQMEQMEKHDSNNNEANLMVYRSLVSEYQMMLEELTSGAYIHVGRLEEHGYLKSGACGGSCRASTERDSIKAELDSMHEDYSKLYDSYKKLRKVSEDQKLEYGGLHERYLEKLEEVKRLQGKMSRLREDAQNKLERASKDVEDCLRERDESLVGLRLKVRQLEMDLKSSQRELEIKKNEAVELRDICDQLMSQMEPASDVEQ